jgi:hypothetical protein
MSGMGDWAKKAEELAKEHPDQADQAVDRAEQFASERTGGTYDEQLAKGADAVQERYGGGQGERQPQEQSGQEQPGQEPAQEQATQEPEQG